jgi:hypothetical protein
MRRFYIIGPIRGMPAANLQQFSWWSAQLRGLGHDVIIPHAIASEYERAMDENAITPEYCRIFAARDTTVILNWATDIFALNGWEHSTRATAGHALAKWIRLPTWYEDAPDVLIRLDEAYPTEANP